MVESTECVLPNHVDALDLFDRDTDVLGFDLSAKSETSVAKSEESKGRCADSWRRKNEEKLTCCEGFCSHVKPRAATEVF